MPIAERNSVVLYFFPLSEAQTMFGFCRTADTFFCAPTQSFAGADPVRNARQGRRGRKKRPKPRLPNPQMPENREKRQQTLDFGKCRQLGWFPFLFFALGRRGIKGRKKYGNSFVVVFAKTKVARSSLSKPNFGGGGIRFCPIWVS